MKPLADIATHGSPSRHDYLQCPSCGSGIAVDAGIYRCINQLCARNQGFSIVEGKPVLIDEDKSIFTVGMVEEMSRGADSERKQLKTTALRSIYWTLTRANPVAAVNAEKFLAAVRTRKSQPRILIVGGGTRGRGTELIWACDIERVSFDVYASENVDFVADAHDIPVSDGAIDGIWIQAVLEHVMDPWKVVSEMKRVLAADGVIYAETPFMQQVHEGAYDFFRFSHSAHRWLFRDFEEIESGQIAGAGTSAIWALRYLARAVSRSSWIGRITGLAFFWLRFFDSVGSRRARLDAASGVYFLGRMTNKPMNQKELAAYYTSGGNAKALRVGHV